MLTRREFLASSVATGAVLALPLAGSGAAGPSSVVAEVWRGTGGVDSQRKVAEFPMYWTGQCFERAEPLPLKAGDCIVVDWSGHIGSAQEPVETIKIRLF